MTKFVLIGNVDNGKSTLGGSILVATNNITEKAIETMKKNADDMKMSSYWLAHLLDTDDGERQRGITHAHNVIQFSWNDKSYEMIDVPGHKDLVQEMIYGTSMADIAVLVLSIRKGEYESSILGQVLEHTLIARGMGISALIVCINKMDLVDWNADEYNRIINDFSARIKKYKFKQIEFVPVSAINLLNIADKYDNALVAKSLMQTISTIDLGKRTDKIIKLASKEINGKFMFYHIDNLISSGFKCKLHTSDKLYDVTVTKVTNDKVAFVTMGNSVNKIIDMALTIEDANELNSNVILRNGNKTIAIGVIIIA